MSIDTYDILVIFMLYFFSYILLVNHIAILTLLGNWWLVGKGTVNSGLWELVFFAILYKEWYFIYFLVAWYIFLVFRIQLS
jgi:hypothetical protein